MREDDHLPVDGKLLKDGEKSFHFRWIHRLNRVVQHYEPEREDIADESPIASSDSLLRKRESGLTDRRA